MEQQQLQNTDDEFTVYMADHVIVRYKDTGDIIHRGRGQNV